MLNAIFLATHCYNKKENQYIINLINGSATMITLSIINCSVFLTWVPWNTEVPLIFYWVPWESSKYLYFDYLGSAKRSIVFQRFRDLKRVEKHTSIVLKKDRVLFFKAEHFYLTQNFETFFCCIVSSSFGFLSRGLVFQPHYVLGKHL
jgi:hypothetical protein